MSSPSSLPDHPVQSSPKQLLSHIDHCTCVPGEAVKDRLNSSPEYQSYRCWLIREGIDLVVFSSLAFNTAGALVCSCSSLRDMISTHSSHPSCSQSSLSSPSSIVDSVTSAVYRAVLRHFWCSFISDRVGIDLIVIWSSASIIVFNITRLKGELWKKRLRFPGVERLRQLSRLRKLPRF